MTIPESQLATWSAYVDAPSSKRTADIIRQELERYDTRVTSGEFRVYLQGSYRNYTNIRRDSDVDIVVELTSIFGNDLSQLPDWQKERQRAAYPDATLSLDVFRAEVLAQLQFRFPGIVTDGNKAITVGGDGQRLNADALVCNEYRHWTNFEGPSTYQQKYHKGIAFRTQNEGRQVLNDRHRRTQRDRLHSHVFRGMLLCGRCHAAGRRFQMVFTKVDGRNGVRNEYYHCIGRQQGKCDLPYLPVSLVEAAVLREVKSIRVTETEAAEMREQVEAQLEARLRSEREARARIKKEMDSLAVKEERLLDLASDGALTTESVKERLAKLQVQRHSLHKRLQMTEDMIRQEGHVVSQYIELLEKPGEFYAASDDMAKRKLLNAFFTHIWIDDDHHRVIPEIQPHPVVQHIHQRAQKKSAENKGTG